MPPPKRFQSSKTKHTGTASSSNNSRTHDRDIENSQRYLPPQRPLRIVSSPPSPFALPLPGNENHIAKYVVFLADSLRNRVQDDTADDYLAAGVKQEEAGEKWRAGDGAKAARFLHRALDTYERGLRQFPNAFDLVYNRARVLFTVTQFPQLAAEFPSSIAGLLEASLAGHRRALTLEPENADALFNTAQLLTVIADTAVSQGRFAAGAASLDILVRYQEAIDLFQKCLAIQEAQYLESQRLAQAQDMSTLTLAGTGDDTEPEDQPMDTGEAEEQWAAIVEPVTTNTLSDTILACLEAVSSLCSSLQPGNLVLLAQAEQIGRVLVGKLQMYVENLEVDATADAIIAHAIFAADVANAHFRLGNIDVVKYQAQLKAAFENPGVETVKASSRYAAYLCAYSDSLVGFSSASDDSNIQLQWSVLTQALDYLAEASKRPEVEDLVAVHLRRGDVELLRFGLVSLNNHNVPAALVNPQVQQTLLKNANTYYRGAVAVANALTVSRGKKAQVLEGHVKLALVEFLKTGNQAALQSLYNTDSAEDEIKKILGEIVGEGLLKEHDVQVLGINAE